MKICIDAGHFALRNQSPVNPLYYESLQMWELSRYLGAELKSYGVTVIYTREDQKVDKPVYDRGKCSKGCDLFLSLHTNATSNKPTEREQLVDRVCVYKPLKASEGDFNSALGSMFASSIASLMGVSEWRTLTRAGTNNSEYYGVMRGAKAVGCPSYFIIESSFHTSPRSVSWLLQTPNLRALASTIATQIATAYSLRRIDPADVNGDGSIDAFDYQLLKAHILNPKNVSIMDKTGDLNGDGKIDAFDYQILKHKIL